MDPAYIKRPDGRIYRRIALVGFVFLAMYSVPAFLKAYPQFIENLPYWEERVILILSSNDFNYGNIEGAQIG